MRNALGFRGGWIWLALCQCSGQHSEAPPAADSGAPEQRALPTLADADATLDPRPQAAKPAAATSDAGDSGLAKSSSPAPASRPAEPTDVDAGDTSAADGSVTTAAAPEDSSCLDASAALDGQGAFHFEAKSTQMLKLWVPELPSGCKAPVVHFANGTGAACSNYQLVLERLASHGFLAVCAETTVTGSGEPGMRALAAVLELYPDLAAHKFGSAGHEAGGQGAILTLQQAEAKWGAQAVYAGLAIAPASGHGTQPPDGTWQDAYAAVRSPMVMMSGGADMLVSESWVGNGYAALNDAIEAYWYSGVDATHIPIPQEHIQQISVAWFRWKLLGDQAACAYFKQLPDGERWAKRAEQNPKGCR